jgi:hypothetical protein
MRVDVDIPGGGERPERVVRRLLFVLSRFAPDVLAVDLEGRASGPGRVRLTARVTLSDGRALALQAEDGDEAAATEHFIDRLGRAVARRLAGRGRR